MQNVTLSAEEELIQRARARAKKQHTTLNQAFRDWLTTYVQSDEAIGEYDALMDRISYVRIGRTFTRDEMNER